jgi:hypothetical protein
MISIAVGSTAMEQGTHKMQQQQQQVIMACSIVHPRRQLQTHNRCDVHKSRNAPAVVLS